MTHDRARAFVTALGLYGFLGGLASFIGWAADVPRLTDWDGNGISIQPNSTLAALAAGAAVVMLAHGRKRAAAIMGTIVALIGASAAFENITLIDLGIDRLFLFDRAWGHAATSAAGRMGPPASTSWTLIGVALVLVSWAGPGTAARRIALGFGLATTCIAALPVIGYLYGAEPLYTIPRLTAIAFQTATFIVAVSIGVIASIREYAPARWFAGEGAASLLAKRLLPLVIGIPVVLGWLRVAGQEADLYDTAFGTAMLVLCLIGALTAVLWQTFSMLPAYESRLRRTERRVTDMIESITDALVSVDSAWRYTYVNDEGERLLGRPRGELLGRVVWDMFPEAVGSDAEAHLRFAMRNRVPVEFEAYAPGRRSWYANRVYPVADGGLSVYFADVSDRKRHEQELRESRARLASELADVQRLQKLSLRLVRTGDVSDLLRDILAASAEFLDTDKGNIQFFDPTTGRLRIAVHQGHGAEFLAHFAEDGCPATCGAAAVAVDRVIVDDVANAPALAGTRDRDVILADGIRSIQSTPLVSRDGRLLGMLNNHFRVLHVPGERELRYIDLLARMATDLIERTQQENALRDADRRKDDFLATLAHELRNPLAPVRHAAHVLKLKQVDPELRRMLDMIERQTSHMSRLVDDLLDVSRIARNQLDLSLEPVPFAEIAIAALDTCRSEIDSRGHSIEVRLPESTVTLEADRHRLIQVFCNLLVNAARYTPPGGRIEFSATLENAALAVRVKDSGIGIPCDRLNDVFEPFTKLDRSLGREGGLGIGLTLARRLVEKHRGTIHAESEGPGRGTMVFVRLPVAPAAVTAAADPVPAAVTGQEIEPRRILVADDSADAAESLAMLLAMAGHEVRTAADGEEALRVAVEFRPDVAFLDLGMPVLDGYAVARRLRTEPWGRGIHLVAVTGWGQEADRRRSRDAGFDAHLVKPASPADIERLLAVRGAGESAGAPVRSEQITT